MKTDSEGGLKTNYSIDYVGFNRYLGLSGPLQPEQHLPLHVRRRVVRQTPVGIYMYAFMYLYIFIYVCVYVYVYVYKYVYVCV
jgi:hypothetical protein